MSEYHPPIEDMQFLLHEVLGFAHEDLDRETTQAVLEEAARLASEVLAPLNAQGDKNGNMLKDGVVTTGPGFKEAYARYCEGGWNAVPFPPAYGGQGLPWALAFPVQEMWQGANLSFGLCPLLNQGAVEAILHHGSHAQKEHYLPRLIAGTWTGTMNLTEPQAGSDLGLLKTRAEPDGAQGYKITGQKIFITYGEHDMAENIIHLVLARLPDAPEDVRGISLFVVPKILEDGTRNHVECIGLEHKLGIHASPTCTMEFSGARGYLIGEAHQGLKYMFTMMNNARLSVGLQGVAIAEHAYQHALAYARERVQGKDYKTGQRVSIAAHTDVKRMLLSMRAQVEAGRALAIEAVLALDAGDRARVDVMTPIVKAWCTDMAVEVASLGVQVFGGAGFIEEAGAAQFYRDARILPIYEGTNGIQALDFAFRKTIRDGGAASREYIQTLKTRVRAEDALQFEAHFTALENTIAALVEAGNQGNHDLVEAMAAPALKALGIIAGGALLSACIAALGEREDDFARQKRQSAEFFIGNILPMAAGHLAAALQGSQILCQAEGF
ncbi:MAG: acyl-CoA dehydrogenase [Alphaproteobacteria bacterium]|nr:acyl-CoA dehydrogenase [Alphaproteobacteria bacterium]